MIAGLTGYVTRAHLARAALEATAWQVKDVVEAMAAESGVAAATLKVDGGMTASTLLMQFQADVLDVPVVRPSVAETTALGAAYAAGLAVGFWSGLDELRANWRADRTWRPAMDAERPAGGVRTVAQGGRTLDELGQTRQREGRHPGRVPPLTRRVGRSVRRLADGDGDRVVEPPRLTTSSTLSPTLAVCTTLSRSSLVWMVLSPALVITSPVFRPAFVGRAAAVTPPTFAPALPWAVPTETPRYGWLTFPPLMIAWATSLARLPGMAKPTPMLPSPWPEVAIAVLMPTTWPARLTSAPPELPGLIAASVWIAPAMATPVRWPLLVALVDGAVAGR